MNSASLSQPCWSHDQLITWHILTNANVSQSACFRVRYGPAYVPSIDYRPWVSIVETPVRSSARRLYELDPQYMVLPLCIENGYGYNDSATQLTVKCYFPLSFIEWYMNETARTKSFGRLLLSTPPSAPNLSTCAFWFMQQRQPVSPFVPSRLDYCNSMLVALPQCWHWCLCGSTANYRPATTCSH